MGRFKKLIGAAIGTMLGGAFGSLIGGILGYLLTEKLVTKFTKSK